MAASGARQFRVQLSGRDKRDKGGAFDNYDPSVCSLSGREPSNALTLRRGAVIRDVIADVTLIALQVCCR